MPNIFTVGETKFQVITDNKNQILDILVSTTPQTYKKELLPKLQDLNVTAKNTPYSRLFRSPLARFEAKTQHSLDELEFKKNRTNLKPRKKDLYTAEQDVLTSMLALKKTLDRISSHYDRFDRHINQLLKANPEDCLVDLISELSELKKEISLIATPDPYSQKWNDLKKALEAGAEHFQEKIFALGQRVPSATEAQAILSIQDQQEHIKSLGTFIAEQLIQISETGIKIAYDLSDNRLKDLIHVPPLVAALSDAKKMLELKSRSLDGAEYNDAYSAMPLSPIDALDKLLQEKGNTDPNQEIQFSLKPYISNWNLYDLDDLVCLISKKPLVERKIPSLALGALKLLASFIEVFAMIFIRLPITVLLTAIDVMGTTLGAMTHLSFFNPQEKWTDKIDSVISELHEKWSLVKAAKQLWNRRYQRLDADEDDHQALLNMIKNESSLFQVIAKEYTPGLIANSIVSSVKTMWENIKRIPQDLFYLLSVLGYNAKPVDVYNSVMEQYNRDKLARHTNPPQDEDSVLICPMPAHNAVNHITTPFEVLREVVVAITDGMVDPMFRKSPATSTAFFILATTTLGTYLLPAALFAGMKSTVLGLQLPTKLLSKAFTGRATVYGLQQPVVACFLEWQLVLPAELAIEIQEGHYDLLASMFHEPEKISLGMVGLIMIGMGLKFIPTVPANLIIPGTSMRLPIIYTDLLNLFTEEAKSSAHGVLPFSLMTKLALGLKAALLGESMLTSSHLSEHQHHEAGVSTTSINLEDTVSRNAYENLLTAISAISDKDTPLHFSSNPLKGAYKFYEHLDGLFDKYNHALQQRGRADLCIDKRDFMSIFYNKYCRQEVSNVLCILSIFPAYPLTLAWRAIKWSWATALNKPALAHQVELQFNKDKVLAMQLVAMITKTTYSASMAISYALRPIVALALLVLSSPYGLYQMANEKMTRKEWFKQVDKWSGMVALHRLNPANFMRPFYARAARKAGSNSNVVEAGEQIKMRLLEAKDVLSQPVIRTDLDFVDTTSQIGEILERHDRCQKNKGQQNQIKQELASLWGETAAKARCCLNVEPTFFRGTRHSGGYDDITNMGCLKTL